jgi:hypothetical protein
MIRAAFAAALLLTTATARAQTAPITASAETQHFREELTIGPMEQMYTQAEAARLKPKSGEIMLSGHMMPMSTTMPTGMMAMHLEVHVLAKADGKPVQNARIAITLIDLKVGKPVPLPVVIMYGIDEGMADTHYGNNVMLSPGRHRVLVSVNGERATFEVDVPMM